MAEGFFSKAKRNVKRAFDYRSDESIGLNRDLDETTAGVDYMMSRGKKKTSQDQSDKPAAERIHKKLIVDQNAVEGGVATQAITSGPVRFKQKLKGHFSEKVAATPAMKLFKRIGRKKSENATP